MQAGHRSWLAGAIRRALDRYFASLQSDGGKTDRVASMGVRLSPRLVRWVLMLVLLVGVAVALTQGLLELVLTVVTLD
jgi:hypothetical protein